ncbi:uncharacterized protein LOC113563070 [Ooceraea biroi]|uniref:uncharacterized protein LOC113563070 n=1 Tax=Ooceraea biroi TaxID=2015173 RepID=UPI000F08BE50|nr:uncharacterized protein LOC113563070 [Ooceraea biroi]
MRRSQQDHSASVREHREPAQQHHHHHHHRFPLPSTSAVTEQHTGRRMSLETLLQAAYYVEQEEKKRERLASTSSSSSIDQQSFASVPPHSNHTYASTEPPRGEYHAPLLDDLSRRIVAMYEKTAALRSIALRRGRNTNAKVASNLLTTVGATLQEDTEIFSSGERKLRVDAI